MVLSLQGEQIVLALGHEPAIARLAQQYLFGLAWGILPALWFLAIRNFMAAVGQHQVSIGHAITSPRVYGDGTNMSGLFGDCRQTVDRRFRSRINGLTPGMRFPFFTSAGERRVLRGILYLPYPACGATMSSAGKESRPVAIGAGDDLCLEFHCRMFLNWQSSLTGYHVSSMRTRRSMMFTSLWLLHQERSRVWLVSVYAPYLRSSYLLSQKLLTAINAETAKTLADTINRWALWGIRDLAGKYKKVLFYTATP
ncbi:hypothetical protein ACVIIV_003286 [Bradyrhizobium sp. USDA 4354]